MFERTSTVSYENMSVTPAQIQHPIANFANKEQSEQPKQEQEKQIIIIKYDNSYRMQQHLLDQLALLQEMRRKLDALIDETQQMLNEQGST